MQAHFSYFNIKHGFSLCDSSLIWKLSKLTTVTGSSFLTILNFSKNLPLLLQYGSNNGSWRRKNDRNITVQEVQSAVKN